MIDTGAAANFGTTYNVEIERKFWLEAVIVVATLTTSAASTTPTSYGPLNAISRVELTVQEGNEGQRSPVNASGPALVEFSRANWGFDSRLNVAALRNGMSGAATYKMVYPVFFRHPLIADPHGSKLCLPLPRYGANPTLKITTGLAADIAATLNNTNGLRLEVILVYRDISDPNFPHWRSELVTDNVTWLGGTDVQYLFPAGGFLTQALHQGFSDSTYRTSAAALSATTDAWKVMWKDRTWMNGTEEQLRALGDFSQVNFGAGVTGAKDFDNSVMLDFIGDTGLFDVFSLASAVDVTPESLMGNYLKLIAGSVTGTKYGRITRHKLLVSAQDLISAKL